MSDNDTPINDNPQVPTDSSVVTFDRVAEIRQRLAATDGGKTSSQGHVEAEDDIPAEQTFEVVLCDESGVGPSSTLVFKGYLVATSVFVGFADKDGIIGSMVPMSKVLYVKAVEVAAA